MKATELMCDDIVLHHGNAYKVFGIMGKANGVDLFPVQLRNAEGLILAPLTCFATEIAPIPLTSEILEKNGVKDSGALSYEFYDGYHVFLYAEKRTVHAGALWFVHELQHALRLCGLHDLADDFKV